MVALDLLVVDLMCVVMLLLFGVVWCLSFVVCWYRLLLFVFDLLVVELMFVGCCRCLMFGCFLFVVCCLLFVFSVCWCARR